MWTPGTPRSEHPTEDFARLAADSARYVAVQARCQDAGRLPQGAPETAP